MLQRIIHPAGEKFGNRHVWTRQAQIISVLFSIMERQLNTLLTLYSEEVSADEVSDRDLSEVDDGRLSGFGRPLLEAEGPPRG